MAFTFACPECQEPLQAPEEAAARRGQCPRCRCTFNIPEVSEGFQEHSGPYGDRPRSRSANEAWDTVRTGLLIYQLGMTAGLIGVAACLAMFFALSDLESLSLLTPLDMVAGLFLLSAMILLLVGKFLCCSAPVESGSRAWAVIAVLFYVLCLVTAMVAALVLAGQRSEALGFQAWPERRPPLFSRIGIAPFLLLIISLSACTFGLAHAFFAVFLLRMARWLSNPALAQSVGRYVWIFGAFGSVLFVSTFLAIITGNTRLDALLPFTRNSLLVGALAIFSPFGLAQFAWFHILITRARRVIGSLQRSIP